MGFRLLDWWAKFRSVMESQPSTFAWEMEDTFELFVPASGWRGQHPLSN